MKRLNLDTGKPFVRGDKRADGKIFVTYKLNRLKQDGFFSEQWVSEEFLNSLKEYQRQDYLKRKQDPEFVKRRRQHNNDWQASKENHVKKLWYGAKHRAKKQGLEFSVSNEYLISIAPDDCPILGIPLSWCGEGQTAKAACPSLDKIKPELGYVEGNVQWISHKANAMKNNATFEELHKFAGWVKNNIPK